MSAKKKENKTEIQKKESYEEINVIILKNVTLNIGGYMKQSLLTLRTMERAKETNWQS